MPAAAARILEARATVMPDAVVVAPAEPRPNLACYRIGRPFAEFVTFTWSVPLYVPDGTGAARPPTLLELNAVELTAYLTAAPSTPIHAWAWNGTTFVESGEVLHNVDIKNVGRGHYDELAGMLTVTMHAGDSPYLGLGPIGSTEDHTVLVAGRYNSNADQFLIEVTYAVRNLGQMPRTP